MTSLKGQMTFFGNTCWYATFCFHLSFKAEVWTKQFTIYRPIQSTEQNSFLKKLCYQADKTIDQFHLSQSIPNDSFNIVSCQGICI